MKKLLKIMSLVSFCLGSMNAEVSGMQYDRKMYEKNVFFTNKPLTPEVINGQKISDGSIYVEAIIGSELWEVHKKCPFLFKWLRFVYISKNTRSIGKEFQGCKQLEYLEVPPEVDTIDSDAFKGCSALKKIKIPSGVEDIEYCAFYGCSALEEIILPKSLKEISDYAFGECRALTEIIIGGIKDRTSRFRRMHCFKKCRITRWINRDRI